MDNNFESDTLVQSHNTCGIPLRFQIFFLAQDQSQSVEVLETDDIDFWEIIQRLKTGESVFIKYTNQQTIESDSRTHNEENQKLWYFNHC
ncbi:MAG: hypothetical protein NWF06_03110 [Candidatus Bathyarchaeota archaeon]|nr:hypothetical protein [Candidatus Bathyarchaeum sp.]